MSEVRNTIGGFELHGIPAFVVNAKFKQGFSLFPQGFTLPDGTHCHGGPMWSGHVDVNLNEADLLALRAGRTGWPEERLKLVAPAKSIHLGLPTWHSPEIHTAEGLLLLRWEFYCSVTGKVQE